MSTNALRNTVDIATPTAASQVAGILANLNGCGRLNLAAADTVLASLAAPDEHTDADKAQAEVAIDAGIRAHSLLMVVKAALLALADPDNSGQLDQALTEAVIAADEVVTASVIAALRNGITPEDAALPFALIAELRRAQQAATDSTKVPDTLPDGWTD